MTGQRPDSLGVWTLPIHFREAQPDAVTLPQWLRRHDYVAVSHGKIFHNPTPDPQSWSETIRPLGGLPPFYPDGTRDRIAEVQAALPANDWRKNNLRGPITAAPELPDNQLLDGARTDMAIEDLHRLASGDQPFFLAMGYIRPHLAWIAPRQYWDRIDPSSLPVLIDQQVPQGAPHYAMSSSYELSHYVDQIDFPTPWEDRRLTDAEARHLMHAYYACVAYVDAQIGRLLDALEETGEADNTIVVLWSDHGWKLGEHNGWGKMTNYEIDTRVPLILAGPGIEQPGESTHELAELVDLFPTLCDLVGIGTPEFAQGESLVESLRDPHAETQAAAFSQYYRQEDGQEVMGYAIRTDRYRFVEWRDFSTGDVLTRELYDHDVDPSESINAIDAAEPELVESLTNELLASHPRRALVMTPAVHSDEAAGRWPTAIGFENQLSVPVDVYPITPRGNRGRGRTLAAGESMSINARIGGVFVVEAQDGSLHEIHSPAYPPRTVVLAPR